MVKNLFIRESTSGVILAGIRVRAATIKIDDTISFIYLSIYFPSLLRNRASVEMDDNCESSS